MTDPFERRKHPRAEADFTLMLDEADLSDGAILVKDVSRAGVCCIVDEPIKVMTEVSMKLEIPIGKGKIIPVQCFGAVVRCDPISEATREKAHGRLSEDAHEVAIFFLHMDEEEREKIDAFVKSRTQIGAVEPTA